MKKNSSDIKITINYLTRSLILIFLFTILGWMVFPVFSIVLGTTIQAIIGLLISLKIDFGVGFLTDIVQSGWGFVIMTFILWLNILIPIACWISIKISAKHINRNYIIKNKKTIINRSCVYFFIIVATIIITLSNADFGIISTLSFGLGIIPTIVFYLSSKKYIKEDL